MAKEKTTKKAEKYWEKRRALEDEARIKLENQTQSQLSDILDAALKNINKQLLGQADLHKMTQQELLSDYNKRDQKKYHEYIDKNYQELMSSDEKYKEFIDEFFPAYDYAKINRLTQVRSDIFSAMASEMIKRDTNGKFDKRLGEVVERAYNSNANVIAILKGNAGFENLPKEEIRKMLDYPWSGESFSHRLWGNVSSLEKKLSQSVATAIASGEGVQEALSTMKLDPDICDMFKLEQNKFNKALKRLVQTEYSHFAVEGINQSLSSTNVKQYQNWSAEDERVCSICGAEHGKIYNLKDAVSGVNEPPWHSYCRCTKIPYIPDLPESIDDEYEAMFGNLLDEFANDGWGIKLTHPKKSNKSVQQTKTKFTKQISNQMGKEEKTFYESLLNGAPDEIKKVWDKIGNKVTLENANSTKGSLGATSGTEVTMNLSRGMKDTKYSKGGNTFFHEMAHAFDHAKTGGNLMNQSMTATTKLANGKTFGQVIYDEVQALIKLTRKEQKVTARDAKSIIYKQLDESVTGNEKNMYSVIDLYGGSTNGLFRIQKLGHRSSYWTPPKLRTRAQTKEEKAEFRNNRLGSEGFAEFMAAHTMDPDELGHLKKWLPESYEAYLELLDKIISD